MSDAWTPSTEQVRSHYVFDQGDRWDAERGESFDRWLAEHDREVIRTYAETLQMGRRRDALLYAERLSTDAAPGIVGMALPGDQHVCIDHKPHGGSAAACSVGHVPDGSGADA